MFSLKVCQSENVFVLLTRAAHLTAVSVSESLLTCTTVCKALRNLFALLWVFSALKSCDGRSPKPHTNISMSNSLTGIIPVLLMRLEMVNNKYF